MFPRLTCAIALAAALAWPCSMSFFKLPYHSINHQGKVVFRYRPDRPKPSMLPYSERWH